VNAERHDYAILGAGPAGLQMAYELQQRGRDFVLLEAGTGPGTFFKRFPRHRKLISINKVVTGFDDREVNLRWDWNSILGGDDGPLVKDRCLDYFPHADTLVEYLERYAAEYRLPIRTNTNIVRISRSDGFLLEAEDGRRFGCDRLIVATGVTKPYVPDIPGIEHVEQYADASVDPKDFWDQSVLILGGGNSGFETADNLIPVTKQIHILTPHFVKFAWRTHFVGHLRAVNNNFLDTYMLKSQNAVLIAKALEIRPIPDGGVEVTIEYQNANGEIEVRQYDRVICCTGFRFDAEIFAPQVRPELTIMDRFPKLTSAFESVNVPGLYFAGTITQSLDFKKTTSGFIHGFRYNVRALARILDGRDHRLEWPHRVLEQDVDLLADRLIDRVNVTSAAWQQFGFIGDVIKLEEDGRALWYEDVPAGYVHDSDFGKGSVVVATLEYGHHDQDPFVPSMERVHKDDGERAEQSQALHPILRHYLDGRLVRTAHVMEDLDLNFRRPVQVKATRAFWADVLEEALVAAAER
jgi:thioredoxin reductase